jgi:hypothetical protein
MKVDTRRARTSRARAVLLTTTCALAAAAGIPASAQAQEEGPPRPADFEISSYAQDAGISQAEARTRLIRQRQIPALARRAKASLADAYTGVWFDDKAGGRIKLVVRNASGAAEPGREDREKARRAIAGAGIGADESQIVGAPIGEEAMLALQSDLDRELLIANVGAADTVDAEPDVTSGRVRLLVPPAPSEAQTRYVESAVARYGDRVSVGSRPGGGSTEACSDVWCDPPLRGGIRLVHNGEGVCTSGFVVKSRSTGVRYLSTAGHCITTLYSNWSTHFADGSSHVIGTVSNYGTTNDFAILNINNPTGWNPGPYLRTASDQQYRISGWSHAYVGMRVCKSGAFHGSSCGNVTGGEATREGRWHTFRADYCGDRGDSGGPVFGSGSANGSHIGGYGPCDKWFFDVDDFAAFNVQVVT